MNIKNKGRKSYMQKEKMKEKYGDEEYKSNALCRDRN